MRNATRVVAMHLINSCTKIIGMGYAASCSTLPSARMRRVTVVVLCVCECVFPRPSSATDATKRQSRHTGGLSIGVFRIMASFRR